jgi:hypothetical protein
MKNLFADIKNIRMFEANYIHRGGAIVRQFDAGIFYVRTLNIFGFVPPCGALMRPLPLWCSSTGKAEPFFHTAYYNLITSVMNYTEQEQVERENSVLSVASGAQTLDQLTNQLQVQGCTKINISFKTNRVSVGYCQNGHNYGARGKTLGEAISAAVQLLQTPFVYQHLQKLQQ